MFGVVLGSQRGEAPELLAVEALVAQAVVKALPKAFRQGLPGSMPWVSQAQSGESLIQLEGDELGTIVASDDGRATAPGEQVDQHALDVGRGQRAFADQGRGSLKPDVLTSIPLYRGDPGRSHWNRNRGPTKTTACALWDHYLGVFLKHVG